MTGAATVAYTPVEWTCPNDCGQSAWTAPWMGNRFHTCPKLGMLTAPLVRAGTRCKVWAQPREDYQGREMTQDDEHGRPWMAVVTTRDTGQDVAVLAPCAQMYG
jgi:hypothetical protein